MSNLTQVESQIRYELEQLSVKNAHHEFEHLCRHLTRARICSNVIPATGPVSGGGDLGRDFETFRSYLNSTPISNTSFIGLVSHKMIAFACSLDKKIKQKIKDDVKTIMESKSPVKDIYFFASSDMQISERHNLKKWAKDEFSVELEILDGQAISAHLSERDTFWIAERYLSIPSEIYPPAPTKEEKDEWYNNLLEEFKGKQGQKAFGYADFIDIKSGVRHASTTESAKQDILFWFSLIEKIIENSSSDHLKRKAIYEASVASLKGLGTLEGQEQRLKVYFKKIPDLSDPSDIEDASVLQTFCMGANFENKINMTIEEILEIRDEIISRTDQLLADLKDMPTTKCRLLEVRGFQSFTMDPNKGDFLDIDDAFKRWLELTDLVKEAPLFPLEIFADRLTHYLHLTEQAPHLQNFSDHPSYEKLSQKVDKLLEERYGGFKAAEKCKDRAFAFHKAGKTLKAINQFHNAKIKWFADETLNFSLGSMLFISRCYSSLGLSFAAKYYALAIAYIAFWSQDEKLKQKTAQALINAAEADYRNGYWYSYIDLACRGVEAHNILSKDESSSDPNEFINRTIFSLVTIKTMTEKLIPQFENHLGKILNMINMDEIVDKLLPTSRELWQNMDAKTIIQSSSKDIDGRPFGDLGKVREVIWLELGINWLVKWENDYQTTKKAEQFIALMQILLDDFAGKDLCLLKTDVNIGISVGDISKIEINPDPSNIGRKWNVKLPKTSIKESGEVDKYQSDIMTAATAILTEISLLPYGNILEIFKDLFKKGLSRKLFIGSTYDILYGEFITKDHFELSDRQSYEIPEPEIEFPIKENEELEWFSGPGPGYDKEKSKRHVKNRYDRLIIPIKHTIKRLANNPTFFQIVGKLKSEGWLDWHILAAVMSATVNYRVNQILSAGSNSKQHKETFTSIMNSPEDIDAIGVPISEYTEKKLKFHQQMNMMSTLKVLELRCKQETPNFKAIDHFLRYRYNYWTDDIEHDDFFNATDNSS